MLKLIVNPTSGARKAERHAAQIEHALAAKNIPFDVSRTTAPGDGTLLAIRAIQDGYSRFGVVGGDGTVNEVVNGLLQASSSNSDIGPLAIFPSGSGNDLAHTLQLSATPQSFADRILGDKQKPINICTATIETPKKRFQRYFVNNAGLGLEAAVVRHYEKIDWVQGHLRYIAAALKTIGGYSATSLSAEWEGLSDEQATSAFPQSMQHGRLNHADPTMLISIGNNRRAGGGFLLTPDAQLDNDLIDVAILRHVSKLTLLRLLVQALQGTHIHHPAVTMVRTSLLSISSDIPLPFQADGELLATDASNIEITLHPRPLQIYA